MHQIWTVNQANHNDWPKETWKMLHQSNSNCHEGVTQQLRDSSRSLPVRLSTHSVLFFLPVNTLLASLLSIFVEILLCEAKEPVSLSLATGLGARIWCFHCRDPASISGWEPRPPEIMCTSFHQAEVLLIEA